MRSLAASIDSGALGTHEPSAGANAALDRRRKSWSIDCLEGPASCILNDEDENRQRLDL
jgi:hypothetical protein